MTGLLASSLFRLKGSESEMSYLGRTCVFVPGRPILLNKACRLDTLTPKEGYWNLYRVVLLGDFSWTYSVCYDYVKAICTDSGYIDLYSLLWGTICIQPESEQIRNQIKERANQFEVRPQRIEVNRTREGTEILISELKEDFYEETLTPSWYWQQRHLESFRQLSKAKEAPVH